MRRSAIELSDEGDTVTTLELFFDLVYVFAFTQVTGLMAHGQAPGSVLDGFIVFALLWWTWCSYAWLGNMARGDRGVMRPVLLAATAAVFVASLAIPEAFDDLPGGVSGPLVLVVCYAVVRFLHIGVYLVAAGSDQALRRQVLISLATSAVPAVALLALGVVLPEWQRPIWLAVSVAAMAIAARRLGGHWPAWRLGLAAGLLALAPLLPDAQPWLALAIVAVALIGTAVAPHVRASVVARIGDGS